MEKELTSVCTAWKAGTSLVITIPSGVRKHKRIEGGDNIFISWGEVEKERDNKKELPEL